MHLGKPLSAYDMSCCANTLADGSGSRSHSPGGLLSNSALSCGNTDHTGGHTPLPSGVPSTQSDDISPPGQAPIESNLIDPVLAFIKAFHL